MSKITLETFKNIFKYYNEEEHQIRAIEILYRHLNKSTFDNQLYDDSFWIMQYRNQADAPQEPEWAISKEQMVRIMGGSIDTISDQIMEDYTRCVKTFKMDRLAQVYFLGQCGHESAGLRYPVEIHDGSNYEGRTDLGNTQAGDGVKYAGTGYIQVTGRYNHQAFADYMESIGEADPRIMSEGKEYSSVHYPWSISGYWWYQNSMNAYCANRPKCTNFQIDEVGARVNGRMRPNGADDRIVYTDKAYRTLLEP